MIWMLGDQGQIRHIKVMLDEESAVTKAYPEAPCGAQLNQSYTDYMSNMMLPAMGFRKCKKCLKWEADRDHAR